ncbi:MAG: helix-turn-helix domain-containing protein [Nitrospirota bacterium]
MIKRDTRSLSYTEQQNIRRKAVKNVLNGGKQSDVARMYGVTRCAVGIWIKTYREGGFRALKAKPRGRPRGGTLSQEQEEHVIKVIKDYLPDNFFDGDGFSLWTKKAVAKYIQLKFGIGLSSWTIGRYLKKWGFDPLGHAMYKLWHNELRSRRSVRNKYSCYWGDTMRLETIFLKPNTEKRRNTSSGFKENEETCCHIVYAITHRFRYAFMCCDQINYRSYSSFMRRLTSQTKKMIYFCMFDVPATRQAITHLRLMNLSKNMNVSLLPDIGSQQVYNDKRHSGSNDKAELIYCNGFAFWINPPTGWIADIEAGKDKDIPVFLHPEIYSIEEAPIRMHVEYYDKKEYPTGDFIAQIKTHYEEKYIKLDPPVQILEGKAIRTADNKRARILIMNGGSGNLSETRSKAVAYIEENECHIFLILIATSKKLFTKYFSLFEDFVKSYSFFTDDVKMGN